MVPLALGLRHEFEIIFCTSTSTLLAFKVGVVPLDIMSAQLRSVPVVSFNCDFAQSAFSYVHLVHSAPKLHHSVSTSWWAGCFSISEGDPWFPFTIEPF